MIVHPIEGSNRAIIADDRLMTWVGARIPDIGSDYLWSQATAIGLVEADKILAGMIVHDYSRKHRNCQITLAADDPRWAMRSNIRALLAYPFSQLGCDRVTTMISSGNQRAIRFNLGLGFQMEGVMRKGFGDTDAVILGLLREETPVWMGFRACGNH